MTGFPMCLANLPQSKSTGKTRNSGGYIVTMPMNWVGGLYENRIFLVCQ